MNKNWKDLVGKMVDERRAKIKNSLKKEVKKMGIRKKPKTKYRLKTSQYLTNRYCFVITQEFFPGNSSGQYLWALYNKKGDLVRTGGMDGTNPGGLSLNEIRDIGDEAILRYAGWLELIKKDYNIC